MNEKLVLLQDELYRLLCCFKRKCEEHNLTYYLFFGTLLGAVRHSGFIPWDDDVDIAMPRKDYEKFIELFDAKDEDDWFIDNYKCKSFESMSPLLRVCSRRVDLRRDRGHKEEFIPAFIGIFPLDGLPSNERKRDKHIKKIMFRYGLLRASRSSLHGMGKQNNRTKFATILGRLSRLSCFGKIYPPRKAAKSVDKAMSKYELNGSKYCHIIDYEKKKAYYLTCEFLPVAKLKFRDEFFVVPENYDSILKSYYGDYMQLPPLDKQKPQHSIDVRFL